MDDTVFPSETGMLLVLVVYWLALVLVRGLTFSTLAIHLPVTAVAVGKQELYLFLSDPQSLKLVHPYTSDVIVEEKKVEADGISCVTFLWVEKRPMTVRSRTRMTRDPTSGTITFDVTSTLLLVKVTWQIREVDDSSDVTVPSDVTAPVTQPTLAQPPGECPPRAQHSPKESAEERGRTADSEGGSDAVTTACDGASGRHSSFANSLLLRGPQLLLRPIGGVIRRAQLDLMEAVQKRYTSKSLKDGEI